MTERNGETPIEVGEHVWGQASCWWYDEAGVAATSNEVDMLDKIERLRASLNDAIIDFQDAYVLKCKADDEIERLRAAGDRLAAAVNAVACSGPQDEMAELTDAFLDWEARRD